MAYRIEVSLARHALLLAGLLMAACGDDDDEAVLRAVDAGVPALDAALPTAQVELPDAAQPPANSL